MVTRIDRLHMPLPLSRTSTARRLALAGVAAALTLAGPAVAPADAARRANADTLRIVSPVAGADVSGATRLTGSAPRSARSVSFRVDAGRTRLARKRGRTRRDGGVLDTTPLRAGRHTITLRAKVRGKLVTKRVRITVSKVRRTLRAGTTTGTSKGGRTKTGKGQTALQPIVSEPTTTAPAPTTTAPPAAGSTIFSDDFESGDFSRWELVQAVSSDRARIAAAPAGRSGNAARFEVRNGDHVNGEPNSRAELAWGGDMFSEGETHTFTWSTYFEPGFSAEDEWVTTTQFKGDGTGGPPLELGVNGETFIFNAGPHMDYVHLFDTPLVRGQWLDITVRVHWSRDPGKGNVEMWYRGQKVVDNYKMATLMPNVDNYFKFGLYRDADIQSTGVVWHDGLTITQG